MCLKMGGSFIGNPYETEYESDDNEIDERITAYNFDLPDDDQPIQIDNESNYSDEDIDDLNDGDSDPDYAFENDLNYSDDEYNVDLVLLDESSDKETVESSSSEPNTSE